MKLVKQSHREKLRKKNITILSESIRLMLNKLHEKKFSDFALSNLSGIHQTTISRLRRGVHKLPKLDNYIAIQQIYRKYF